VRVQAIVAEHVQRRDNSNCQTKCQNHVPESSSKTFNRFCESITCNSKCQNE
jgi:hypothetical protein